MTRSHLTRANGLFAINLLVASLAIGGCAGGEPVAPSSAATGTLFEVYHQGSDGDRYTLGGYDPAAEAFIQESVDWPYAGYWFETTDGTVVEAASDASAIVDGVTLELGARYAANLWVDQPFSGDAVRAGQIVVDDAPYEGTLEALAKKQGRCTKQFEERFSKVPSEGETVMCINIYYVICGGRVTSRTVRTVGLWNCY